MTILILKSGDLTVATNAWTATDYRGSKVQIHFTASLRCVNLDLTLDEFLGMIEILGRQADLRRYQLEIPLQKQTPEECFHAKVSPNAG